MHEGHRDRVRKSYLASGGRGMHDHQLLELLLTYAIPRKDTNPLAHRLLKAYGTLEKVLCADPKELMLQEGVGQNTAVLLSLIGTMAGRCITPKQGETVSLGNPAAAAEYCRGLFFGARYEEIYVISLDAKHSLIHADKVASGTLNETVIYPRLVLECALRNKASSIILSHNHPSGDPKPSGEDISTTHKVYEALNTVGIALFDHIIVGRGSVFSMVRNAVVPSAVEAED